MEKGGNYANDIEKDKKISWAPFGLVLNLIVLWNTIYIDAILAKLRLEGHLVKDEDVARLSPLVYEHINMLGRYSFAVPADVIRGNPGPLRNPTEEEI